MAPRSWICIELWRYATDLWSAGLQRLLEHGRRVDSISFWENGERRVNLDFAQLGGKHPFVLVVPQSLLEAELENRLLSWKVKIQWNQRLEELEQHGEEIMGDVPNYTNIAPTVQLEEMVA